MTKNCLGKRLLCLLLFSFVNAVLFAQADNPKYDKALAESLGGDDYGMKSYVLVILKTGENNTTDKAKIDNLFKGHMDNINRLANDKKLVVAGPLKKNEKAYRGIFILDVRTVEEARVLIDTDPAVKEKLLAVELFQWYGSAALPLYLESHYKIEKKKM